MAFSFNTTGTTQLQAAEDLDGKRTYTLTIELYSDDQNAGGAGCLASNLVPKIGDPYAWGTDTDGEAYCIGRNAVRDKDLNLWVVTINYSTLDEEELKKLQHPHMRPAEISSNSRQLSKIVEKDINGNAVLNSANKIFNPPPERETSRKVLTITKLFPQEGGPALLAYYDAINSDAYLGAAVGTLRIISINEKRNIEQFQGQTVESWERTISMEYKADGWQPEYLDAGAVDSTGKPFKINGVEVNYPLLLDGSGQPLSPQTLTPVYVGPFDVYQPRPFATLNQYP